MIHNAYTLQKAFGYMFEEEVAALKRMVLTVPRGAIVINIGAGAGTSGLAFKETRPDIQLCTVDITDTSSPFGCLEAERQILKDAGLWDERVAHFHADSKRLAETWTRDFTNEFVGLVFIDGDHTYEGCKGDIQGWLPLLAFDGIVAVHDYDKSTVYANKDWNEKAKVPHPKDYPGVDQAVNELLVGKYPVVEHVRSLIAFKVNK